MITAAGAIRRFYYAENKKGAHPVAFHSAHSEHRGSQPSGLLFLFFSGLSFDRHAYSGLKNDLNCFILYHNLPYKPYHIVTVV